jgi:hypothetical protein
MTVTSNVMLSVAAGSQSEPAAESKHPYRSYDNFSTKTQIPWYYSHRLSVSPRRLARQQARLAHLSAGEYLCEK